MFVLKKKLIYNRPVRINYKLIETLMSNSIFYFFNSSHYENMWELNVITKFLYKCYARIELYAYKNL